MIYRADVFPIVVYVHPQFFGHICENCVAESKNMFVISHFTSAKKVAASNPSRESIAKCGFAAMACCTVTQLAWVLLASAPATQNKRFPLFGLRLDFCDIN